MKKLIFFVTLLQFFSGLCWGEEVNNSLINSLMKDFYLSGIRKSEEQIVSSYLDEAYQCYLDQDYRRSIDVLGKVLVLSPRNKDALLLLGYNLISLSDYASAERIFLRVLNYYPNDLAALYGLVHVYKSLGEEVQVFSILKEIYQKFPDKVSLSFKKILWRLMEKYGSSNERYMIRKAKVERIYNELVLLCKRFLVGDGVNPSDIIMKFREFNYLLRRYGWEDYKQDFRLSLKSALQLISIGYVNLGRDRIAELIGSDE